MFCLYQALYYYYFVSHFNIFELCKSYFTQFNQNQSANTHLSQTFKFQAMKSSIRDELVVITLLTVVLLLILMMQVTGEPSPAQYEASRRKIQQLLIQDRTFYARNPSNDPTFCQLIWQHFGQYDLPINFIDALQLLPRVYRTNSNQHADEFKTRNPKLK